MSHTCCPPAAPVVILTLNVAVGATKTRKYVEMLWGEKKREVADIGVSKKKKIIKKCKLSHLLASAECSVGCGSL